MGLKLAHKFLRATVKANEKLNRLLLGRVVTKRPTQIANAKILLRKRILKAVKI